MNNEITYLSKDQEVVTVIAETEQEKEDLVSVLEKNEALYTVDSSDSWICISV